MIKQKHFESLPFLAGLSFLTLIFWFFGFEFVGMPLFAIAAIAVLALYKNGMLVVPFFLNMLFMISQTEWSLDLIPTYLYLMPVLIIIGFIIHFVRFKPKFNKGKLFYPLLLLFIGMLLSMINAQFINSNYLFYLVIGLFYMFIYFFFKSTINGESLHYLIKIFAVSGVLVSIQVLIYYIRVDDVILALATKNLDLGWGISNFVATYLIMFIAAMFYFIKIYKLHIIPVMLATFEIIMLIFTLSRGGILSFVITFVLLMVYLFHNCEQKKQMAINIVVAIIVLSIFVFIRFDIFETIYKRLADGFFIDNGRFTLWKEAWENFAEHPLLGAGLFARVEGNYFGFYHNTFMHTLATLGIIGIISIVWQIIEVIKMFINRFTIEKTILLIALIGANIHGMVDNVYYMPQFMIIFFIIISAVENYNESFLKGEVR
jgi:O-antigen ligase